MNSPATATLKSTGETVRILAHDPHSPGGTSGGRYLCLLPPQHPGHNSRKEWIGAGKLRFQREN